MDKTLLEKAKEIESLRESHVSKMSSEEIEVLIAYIKQDISLHQLKKALNIDISRTNFYTMSIKSLRQGLSMGIVKLEFIKKHG